MEGVNIGMDAARPELTEAVEPSEENVFQWPNWSWSPLQARIYPQRPIQKCSWGPYQTPQASNWPCNLGMTGSVGYNPRIRMSWGSIGQYPGGRSEATEGKFTSGKIMKSKRKKMSASKRRALKKKRLLLNSKGDSDLSANICFSTTNSISTRCSSPVRSSSRASTNRWSRSPSPINFPEDMLVPNANRSRSLSPTIFPITSLATKTKSSPPVFMHLASLSDSKMINNIKPKSRSVLDIFLQSLPDPQNFHKEVCVKDIHQPMAEKVKVEEVKSHQKKIFLNRSPLHFDNTSSELLQSRPFDNFRTFINEVSTDCDNNTLVQQNKETVLGDKQQEKDKSEVKSLDETSDQITCLVNSDVELDSKGMKQLSFKSNIASSDLATPPVNENIRQWNFSPVQFPSLSDDSLPWNTSPLPFITPIGSFSDNHMESVESPQVLAPVLHPNDNSISAPSLVHDSQNNELEEENELSKKKEFNFTESQHKNSLSIDPDSRECESSTEITPQSEARQKISIFHQNSHDGNSLEALSLLENKLTFPCDKLQRGNIPLKTPSYDKTANLPMSGLSTDQDMSSKVSVRSEKQAVSSESESQPSSVSASLDHKPFTEQMMLVQESESYHSNSSGSEKVIGGQPKPTESENFLLLPENYRSTSQSGSKCTSTDPDRDLIEHTTFKDWSLSPNIPSESPSLLSPKAPSSDSSNVQVDIYELMPQNVYVKSNIPSQLSENRSPTHENRDKPSRSPSPSSEGGGSRSRSPTTSSEGSEARSRSPSSSSQSNARSRSRSQSSNRSDSRSRSSSPSTEGSDIRSRSTSSSSGGTGVRSRSPSPLSQSSYVRSRSPSVASERTDTKSRSTFSSPERSFTTSVTQSVEDISKPQENILSILDTTDKHMAVKNEQEKFISLQKSSSENYQSSWTHVLKRPLSPCDRPLTCCQNKNSSSLDEDDKGTSSKRGVDEVIEPQNSPQNPYGKSNLFKNDQCLEESRNVELEKSSMVERSFSPGNESVHPNIDSSSYMESENSFVPKNSSLTPPHISTDSLRDDNNTKFENSVCGSRLASPHSTPTSVKLSENESVDIVFSMEKNIPTDSTSVEELKPNDVLYATASYITDEINMNSSTLDAPMNLSKDTNENSSLASGEKLNTPDPVTENLSDKSDYLSLTANVSETIPAIHSASSVQEEVLGTKEKQYFFDKVEEAIDMTENSPSDICEFENTSSTVECSPTTTFYVSGKNSPMSFSSSPPITSSDDDMSTGSNDDSNVLVTKSNFNFNREITLSKEQNTNEICKQGLKRARSSSPQTLHREKYSLSSDLPDISNESEDQTPSCQKRLKFSSSGGRLLMNKQACKLFAAQDSKKQVFKRQRSVRGVLLELYEGSGHKGIFTPKLYHQNRRLRTIATRSSAKKLKRRTPNHDLKYISQKRMDLIKAVEEGRMPKIQELIQDMGPVLREEKTGSTLLHVAVVHNQVDVVLFLLQLINPNVVNNEGETPAHLAAFMGHTQILRILLTDVELCHEKKNRQGRTYTNLLSAPLCDAVLGKDRSKVQELLKLGADPDYNVGDVVKGQLPPDVRVSTPRQLATDLGVQDILQIFPKKIPDVVKKMREPDVVFTTKSVIPNSDEGKHYPDPVAIEVTSTQEPPEGDVYPVNTEPRGFVCILDYNTFRDRQDLDLEGSMQDISNLSSVFSKMGYAGEIYSSPTADETTEILQNVRSKEILKEVGCLVVVVNSHGVGEDRFLTSDLKLMDISRTCGLFKDSDCTHMANKPKIFLFNTGSGLYRESKKGRYTKPLATRVSEPLRDALCLFSSNSGFASWACSDKGTPFYLAFCNTLAKHAHGMEINDLFREFLKEYAKSSPVTVPELRNIGFCKKFFFNPVM